MKYSETIKAFLDLLEESKARLPVLKDEPMSILWTKKVESKFK